jgi:hypothetical protein
LIAGSLLLAAGLLPLCAAEHDAPPGPKALPGTEQDRLHALPVLAKPTPQAVAPLPQLEELAPGVRIARGACVVLDGAILFDQGPVDGMEVFACLTDGKRHESLIKLDTNAGQLVKAACIAALGLTDGQPTAETSGVPARGTPVSLQVRWKDAQGKEVGIAASSLVRDRVVDQPYPALPWIYTGSRFEQVFQNGPDGKPQKREVFMLDATRSIVVNFDEPDSLIASPFPGADVDLRFEANSAICPMPGTPVQLVIAPAQLALTLTLSADGQLSDAAGVVLDQEALARTLKTIGDAPLRAVGIKVAAAVPRQQDVAARTRILVAAATAQVWAVPVFVLAP